MTRLDFNPDVKLSKLIEPTTVLAVLGAIASLVQARETSKWRSRLLQELNGISIQIHELRAQIAELGVHVSREIDRAFFEDVSRRLVSTIRSYNANYAAYSDGEFSYTHANRLLQPHELRVLELLEFKDVSTIIQVTSAFFVHHDLMYFAKLPPLAKKSIYQIYLDFYTAALDPEDEESWPNRLKVWAARSSELNRLLEQRHPPYGTAHLEVEHREYTFEVRVYTEYTEQYWRRTGHDAFVRALPPPSPGRVGDRFDLSIKGIGEHVADANHCWSVGGGSCSQIFGRAEDFDSSVMRPFNVDTANLKANAGRARLNLTRAKEGIELATKMRKMTQALLSDPDQFTPGRPK